MTWGIPSKRDRRKAMTARDPYYVPPVKNTTLIAMLVLKDPRCIYCKIELTNVTAELDKNDLAGPAIVCVRCNNRKTVG